MEKRRRLRELAAAAGAPVPAGARETYLTIAGGDMGEMTYAAWLTSLGMQTPFDPALYQAIVART